MAVSLLSMGLFTQPELAGLKNPSMAAVLEKAVGTWGAVLIYIGLIVSVGGGFLAWMLLAAESLFTPAGGGVMPSWLARQNHQKVPANALWLTNAMVQIFLVVTLFSKASYLALISLSTAMILLPYLFSAVYGLTLAWRGEGERVGQRASDTPVALIATVYCVWLLYAAGLKYLLLSSLLYAPGVVFYIWAKKQRAERPFTGIELGILALVMVLAIAAIALLATGRLSL
jgi:arginine:ornithine antiporter / lysine permease